MTAPKPLFSFSLPFSHGFHLSLTAIALLVGGSVVYVKLGNSAETDVNSKGALAAHAAVVRHLSADSAVVATRDREIAALTAQHEIDQGRFATLLASTPVQASDTALVHACVATVRSCEARGDSLASQVTTLKADLAAAKADAANVADTLHRKASVDECHLVHAGPVKLLGCPNRRQVGGIFFTLGVIVKSLL